ncbi:MAG: hypothetical protein WBH82_05705 [Arcanobacterium sp.]
MTQPANDSNAYQSDGAQGYQGYGAPQGASQQGYQGYGSPQGAPQGYQGYGAPMGASQQPSGIAGLFSMNFNTRFTQPLAKLIMLFAIILAAAWVVDSVWSLIVMLDADFLGGFMGFMSWLWDFVIALSMSALLLGATRVFLEYFVKNDQGSDK